MKKTVAILVAAVLVLSFAVSAMATGSQAIILGNAKFTELNEEQIITIEAENLDSISVINLVLQYDSEKIELLNVVEDEESTKYRQVEGAAGDFTEDATICRPEKGIITIVWDSTEDLSGSGTIANLTFKALTADAGIQKISLTTYDGDSSYVCRDNALSIPIKIEGFEIIEKSVGVTVSGTVTSYLDAEETVTIGLYEGENAEPSYETTVTGNSAEYSISEVAAGTYTMKVSKANHVAREYEITVESEDVEQDAKICPIGDANCNGSINLMDYRKILQHIRGNQITDPYELLCADANQNGSINLMDYRKVLQHIRGTSMWT